MKNQTKNDIKITSLDAICFIYYFDSPFVFSSVVSFIHLKKLHRFLFCVSFSSYFGCFFHSFFVVLSLYPHFYFISEIIDILPINSKRIEQKISNFYFFRRELFFETKNVSSWIGINVWSWSLLLIHENYCGKMKNIVLSLCKRDTKWA